MVMGRPYHTARYLSSSALEETLTWYYPTRLKMFSQWIQVLESLAKEVPAARIPTSSILKSLHNGLTNFKGMIEGARNESSWKRKRPKRRDGGAG